MKLLPMFIVLLLLLSCGGAKLDRGLPESKVVVLGFDGVDPDLVNGWIEQLPNIRSLSESGTLTRLGTTNPPESPVAWASFATGMNPGKHGIFDFLRRDPETYYPAIGLVEVEKARFLFGFLPIKGPKISNNRKGIPYWKYLDSKGISSVNLRMPLEFPANELDHGITWSGLGVPDIRGTWGTYFYLSTDLTQWDLGDTEFGGRMIRLELRDDNTASAVLDGPIDVTASEYARLEVPLELELNSEATAVTIRMQGQEETVEEGRWSNWYRFEFSMGPLVKLNGVSRFYVLECFPELRVYLMPISFDPYSPPVAISNPAAYTEDLAAQNGPFKTLGWIHETWGLNEERIDEGVFLEDMFRNMDNLQGAILSALDEGQSSLYSAVFTATDSVSHMFFRLLDPQHTRYDPVLAEQYGDAVLRVYQKMDSIIGETAKRLGPKDLLLVVSDHGFHSWRKEFNTNTWLVKNGFMALQEQGQEADLKKLDDMFSGGSFFPNVDWTRTKAYALGLGHIYINLKGRESRGIVEPGKEYEAVVRQIREEIVKFRDPDTGQPVLQNTYFKDDIYTGQEMEHAGDIQLTFESGYRTSWQTSLGAIPEGIVVANIKKWSGDHCASDFTNTAGFLVSNRPIASENPHLMDIAPTLYQHFSLEIPPEVDGKPIKWMSK